MAQGVNALSFFYSRFLLRAFIDFLRCPVAQMLFLASRWKEPCFRLAGSVVVSQFRKKVLRQKRVAVLAALAPLHSYEHPFAVYVRGLESHHLAHPDSPE